MHPLAVFILKMHLPSAVMEYTVIIDYFRRCRDVSSTTKNKNPSFFLFQQISYADMLTKVDPLRNELKSLEIEAQASRIKVT